MASLNVITQAGHHVDDGDDQGNKSAPGEADEGIGITKGADEVTGKVGTAPSVSAEEAAHVDHTDNAEDNEHYYRQYQVDDRPRLFSSSWVSVSRAPRLPLSWAFISWSFMGP